MIERPRAANRSRLALWLGAALMGCCVSASTAEESSPSLQMALRSESRDSPRERVYNGMRELEVNVGFASNLQLPPSPDRSDVRFVTVTPRYGWFESDHREVLLEMPILISTRPQTRGGIGFNALVRHHFKTSRRFAPFVEIGGGILGTRLHVKELGGTFQFTPQAGAGFRVRVGTQSDFVFSARFHHISNAGLRRPNVGLNSLLFMVGFAKHL